jgi:hypothetical protein
MNIKYLSLIALSSATLLSCSKLDEKLNGTLNEAQANSILGNQNTSGDVSTILASAYEAMRSPYQDQSRFWAASEHTTDHVIGPTRGGDWDDGGVWRVLHSHKWNADHAFLADTYRELLGITLTTTDLLRFNPTPQQAAEARFLRAFAMFSVVDGWDQVPYRENTADASELPKVRKGTEALNYIISEVEAIMANLPDGPAFKANKDAAKAFLMKCYLNKGVIANRVTPTFAPDDMAKVIALANELKASPRNYSLTPNFFDNFAPKNDALSKELIFTNENRGGQSSGNVRSRWFLGLHYNQNPSGWNGFTTLSDLYDKFEPADKRLGQAYQGVTNVTGLRVGFLFGQQFDQNGVALKDRKGNALSFTKEVKLIETGNDLEITGIRVMKYPPDLVSGDNADNDYVLLRYADVLLMKAEAILRSPNGSATEAAALVNEVRTRAGLSNLTTITLPQLLDERARELYWEGWRRNDLIRFGEYLTPRVEKAQSEERRLLFPIPNRSLAANPNLVQNPGY